MKLKKSLALLLTLALLLSVTPVAAATGEDGGAVTEFQSTGTIVPQTDKIQIPDEKDLIILGDLIKVTISNKDDPIPIQVNPYGMEIVSLGTGLVSNDSIVTTPITVKNWSDVEIEITVSATAKPEGNVALDSKPTRYVYQPDPFAPEEEVPNEERIYLYMQMESFQNNNIPVLTDQPEKDLSTEELAARQDAVITKDGGSKPITKKMEPDGGAVIQIFGNTSIPSYYGAWTRGDGVTVKLLLSFMPKQKAGYTVSFDAADIFWKEEGIPLFADVQIKLEGGADLKVKTGATSSYDKETGILTIKRGHPGENVELEDDADYPGLLPVDSGIEVTATENLTFTIYRMDMKYEKVYMIQDVFLIRDKACVPAGEEAAATLYHWDYGDEEIPELKKTINAAEVQPGERIRVGVIMQYTGDYLGKDLW